MPARLADTNPASRGISLLAIETIELTASAYTICADTSRSIAIQRHAGSATTAVCLTDRDIAARSSVAGVTLALERAIMTPPMATAVQRHTDGEDGDSATRGGNIRRRSGATSLLTSVTLVARRSVTGADTIRTSAESVTFLVAADASVAWVAHTPDCLVMELAVLTLELTTPARAIGITDAASCHRVTGTLTVAGWCTRARRHRTVDAIPEGVTDTLLLGLITASMATAVSVGTWAAWLLTEITAPRVSRLGAAALANAVEARTPARTFAVATISGPARLAHTNATVHGRLGTVEAGQLTGITHEIGTAVLAHGTRVGHIDTGTLIVTVGLSRAVEVLTTGSRVARETRAVVRVAFTTTRAGQAKFTRAGRNLADGTTEALEVIALTDILSVLLDDFAVACTLHVTASPCPARITLADARVHRLLNAIRAGYFTGKTHPTLLAALACGNLQRIVTVAKAITVRCSLAVGGLTSRSRPAFITLTDGVARVALAMPRAGLARGHTLSTTEPTNARRALAINAGAISGTARVIAKRAPEAEEIVADTGLIFDRPVERALCIASATSPAGVAHANARIGRAFDAMYTRLLTCRAHPVLTTILALWSRKSIVAEAFTIAVRCTWAIRRLTPRSRPAGLTYTLRLSGVAFSVSRAGLSLEHTVLVTQTTDTRRRLSVNARSVSRTAGVITEGTPVSLQIGTETEGISLRILAVIAALSVTALTRPSGVALAEPAVLRCFQTMAAGELAPGAHPVIVAVDAVRATDICQARAAVEAVRFTRAIGTFTAEAGPAWLARTRVSHAVTIAPARAVFSNSWTARNITELATPAFFLCTADTRAILLACTMTRAFSIAANTCPALFTDTYTRVGRCFRAVDTVLIAVNAHVRALTINAAWRYGLLIACSSAKAVRVTRTIHSITAFALPSRRAGTRMGVGIASTSTIAVLWTLRNLTDFSSPDGGAIARVVETLAVATTRRLTEATVVARITTALTLDTRSITGAQQFAVRSSIAWIADTLTKGATDTVTVTGGIGIALILAEVARVAWITIALGAIG